MTTDPILIVRRAVGDMPRGKFPDQQDVREKDGMLFPILRPAFRLAPGQRIFTIGSCFARNIEDFLGDFDVPTRDFSVDKSEWASRPNGLLNEYNPGTIAQRLARAVKGETDPEATLIGDEARCFDMLLPIAPPVTRARAIERRAEIGQIYAALPDSDVIIVTLGLTECWYDNLAQVYLNRIPSHEMMSQEPGRFAFYNLDIGECVDILGAAMDSVLADDRRKVLLTVSPVPLQRTFSGQDCVVANMRSKSVLRAAADQLCAAFPGRMDYFPSYEIAMSGGLATFGHDNVHVRPAVVQKIVAHLMAGYLDG